ncbi:MAG: hypothetical protein WA754_14085 [Pseudolabrys sp.]
MKRRNTAKFARCRKPAAVDATERTLLLTRERDEALEQQSATSEVQEINAAFSTVAKSSAGALLVGGGAFLMVGLAR